MSVRYHPFIIDGRTQTEGEDKQEYCRRRGWGGGWKPPDLRQWKWWPNTENAHRLCMYLESLHKNMPELSQQQKDERSHALVRKYYELTYDRDCNISTPEGAAQALEELGYAKASDAVEWLRRGGGVEEVNAALQDSRRGDIHSVPHYSIKGAAGGVEPFGGAQDSKTFYSMLKQVAR